MTTDNKFAEEMTKRSYTELLEIVGKLKNDYQPDAIVAAEEELKKRKPSGKIIEPAEKKSISKKQSIADKANTPLQTHWKILTLLLPGLLNLIIADDLKAEGYERQHKEIWQWFFYGLGFYIVLLILFIILSTL